VSAEFVCQKVVGDSSIAHPVSRDPRNRSDPQRRRRFSESRPCSRWRWFGFQNGLENRSDPGDTTCRRNTGHKWRVILQDILFKEGDIVEHGEEAEEDKG
jgi:hypothetical protein